MCSGKHRLVGPCLVRTRTARHHGLCLSAVCLGLKHPARLGLIVKACRWSAGEWGLGSAALLWFSRLSAKGRTHPLHGPRAELPVSIVNKDLLEFISGFQGGSYVAPVGVGTLLVDWQWTGVRVEGLALHCCFTCVEFICLTVDYLCSKRLACCSC